MGVSVLRCFEYSLVCDRCGYEEVLHTGDGGSENYVNNIHTAIKCGEFHRSKGNLLCDECFEKQKLAKGSDEE